VGNQKKEAVLLKKIGERAKLRQHVQIDVTAGQIGIMGPKGYKGYAGVQGFQGPQGRTGGCLVTKILGTGENQVQEKTSVDSYHVQMYANLRDTLKNLSNVCVVIFTYRNGHEAARARFPEAAARLSNRTATIRFFLCNVMLFQNSGATQSSVRTGVRIGSV